jgi:hypothetical protein
MLWELLVAIGSVMFLVAGVQSARQVNAGPGGVALVVSIGILFALAYEWAAHKCADVFDNSKNRWTESAQKWGLRVMYFAPVLFLPFAALLGEYVSLTLLRLR